MYARYSVKFLPGFKVSVDPNSNCTYKAGTSPDMRTSYDPYIPFEKLDVDYCEECDPIFKDNSLKSASLVTYVIKESEEKASINLFPNPANNRLAVTCNESLQSITLLDVAGDVVLEFCDLHTKTHTLDISCINQGVYVVKTITQNGYEKVDKLLKKE